jgi:hypothetical protein
VKEPFDTGKNFPDQPYRRAHRFGHGALEEVHFVGGSEIERKNIEEDTDKDEDQDQATQTAKPNVRIKKFHIRHFDLEN